MTRNNLLISVPSFFKCPISLDVMKSPVSLCTGVTYDRASIQTWLDNGNNTCPATMQPLQTKDFVPNHTLHRLIQTWESRSSSAATLSDLLHSLNQPSAPASALLQSLTHLSRFLHSTDPDFDRKSARDFLLDAGSVPLLVDLLSGKANDSPDLAREAVQLLSLLLTDLADAQETLKKSGALSMDPTALLRVLLEGDYDSRIDAANVLQALISIEGCDVTSIVEREGVLSELISLATSEEDTRAVSAGLACLVAASARRRIRSQIVGLGAVPVLGRILSQSDSVETSEKALKILEALSTCADGRAAICKDPACVPAVLQRMLKVSIPATERAVVVLWSVCHLFRDQRAQEAVSKGNGLTKILLVMQSGCSPTARQMCADLVKIFRVNSKSCLSSYDTKTTHIMPF